MEQAPLKPLSDTPQVLKICGLTNITDARFCAASMKVDFLGFIRVENSPRYIEAKEAKEIIEWLSMCKTVGVYVNPQFDFLNSDAAFCGFDYVQLHGEESPAFCQSVKKPIIKAFRVKPSDTVAELAEKMEAYRPFVSYFLLDTFNPDAHGGTGETFNWEIAAELAKSFPIFLAGGLNPQNAKEARDFVKPFALDLSSGVEEFPGQKDFDKLEALFTALSP